MHTLALDGVVVEKFVFAVNLLLVAHGLVSFKCRELGGDVGQNEELGVVNLLGQPFCTLVGKVARVLFFVNNEVQRCNGLGHFAVVVFHINLFGLQHSGFDALFGEIFDERFVLWQRLERTIEREETLV